MRSLKYLNTVLTIIAILLTLNLWALWMTSPGGSMLTTVQPAHGQGTGPKFNATAQRKAMVEELESIDNRLKTLDDLKAMFKDGSARVRVEVMPEEREQDD